MQIEELCVNTIRTLAMDAIQEANSGHPGAPMALAPVAYVLCREMRYNPHDPAWFDRDRFVLSAGHASMLLYAMLYLSGYDLSLDEIRRFRQWESRTPGHPEYGLTPGVETTTGPLGQGLMSAVGMAMAEAHLAACYNRPGHEIVDHLTYVICSDGDMMEGASHEAASIAGHLGLGKLVVFYDDNRITIDGPTDLTYSDDVAKRFAGYGWHVQDLGESANDLDAISAALEVARSESRCPSLIVLRSHIGYGSPNKQDTAAAHGSPLGEQEVALTKRGYGWPESTRFLVPERALEHMRGAVERGRKMQAEWETRLAAYGRSYPELAANLATARAEDLPADWDADLPSFRPDDGPLATRAASGKILNAIAARVPWLIGGSADLSPSNNTLIADSGDFGRDAYANRNLRWGIREHVMCAGSSGIALHGGLRPYAGTFLVFTDYARPAIRLAALMGVPVIYVMTHDSIGLGEDGPTHQPVEQLAALRAMPGLRLIRPADANETVEAWREAMTRTDGPTMLVLTRQKVPVLSVGDPKATQGLRRGAYILSDPPRGEPRLILIASGSEVALVLEAQRQLDSRGVAARVVSMPSWEIFREQDEGYRDDVLPPRIGRRLAIEAGARLGWHEWIGRSGSVIGIETFGASAPGGELFRRYGFTVENVVAAAERLMEAE
jgi:transketolase